MIRFTAERICNFVVVWCLAAAAVQCELPQFRNPADLRRISKCVYQNVVYEAGDFVKTGQPCLNCTCSYGTIVCHLRVCSPIPNPPPQGCFVLHKKDFCCPELICNEDNNVLYEGLEGRSRPGASEDTEIDLENLAKSSQNRGCVINGTAYAEGSALSSSTDCNYCFCMKGKEHCVRPNCVLQLADCTPVFRRHACCPVKYNCHGSDNVTIISTELSFTHASKITTPKTNEELLTSENKIPNEGVELKSTERGTTSREYVQKNHTDSSFGTFSNHHEYQSNSNKNGQETKTSADFQTTSSSTVPEFVKITDIENSTSETVTEISTSISLIETDVVVLKEFKPVNETESSSTLFAEERRNTFANLDSHNFTESTSAYDKKDQTNFTAKDLAATTKTFPFEIEMLLNMTKKKPDDEFELDYDEPTLPPSLPNLKIIPFVAADALDKPKDATIEHREDIGQGTDVTDLMLESPVSQTGQFSPPVKTEGGFVPRDPILDGPFFETKFNSIYHTNENSETSLDQHHTLPSITEPAKIVETALCTNGYLTYRHGELVTEPKACNMCLCLYGEIVCQEPECPKVKTGCRRVKYNEDFGNCCGEIVCDDDVTSTTTVPSILETDQHLNTVSSVESDTNISTPSAKLNEIITESNTVPTFPPTIPTYMTIKVKGKNQTTTRKQPSSTSTTTSAFSTTNETVTHLAPIPILNISTFRPLPTTESVTESSAKLVNYSTTDKVDADYDSGFSLENMLSFLFDEPPVLKKTKNTTASTPKTISTTESTTSTTMIAETRILPTVHLLTTKTTTEETSAEARNEILSTSSPAKVETDSAIYMIKNENVSPKNTLNYSDDQTNSIQQINSYYVPPLGNFEEVILNPTKKPFLSNKKPLKGNGGLFSSTLRPRHTTAKVIPLTRPHSEKHAPQIPSGDPGVASGFLKLSGCNIFGKMYRVGKIIAELSGPCLQCMCAEVGVQCAPLKC